MEKRPNLLMNVVSVEALLDAWEAQDQPSIDAAIQTALVSTGAATHGKMCDALAFENGACDCRSATVRLAEKVRLIGQWADAVDPMPDELRAELRDLRAAASEETQ